MNNFTFPIELNKLYDIKNDDILDFHNPNFGFDDAPDNINAALLFLRNSSINCNYSFSNCTNDEIISYLKIYMNKRYNIFISYLMELWYSLLVYNISDENLRSEINKSHNNIEYLYNNLKNEINDVIRFIISIPLNSIYIFSKHNNLDISFDEYKNNNISSINLYLLFTILGVNNLGVNIINHYYNYYTPEIYEFYFNTNQYVNDIYHIFPYLSFLELLGASDDIKENFINSLNTYLDENIENKNI